MRVNDDDLENDEWGEYYEYSSKPYTGIAFDTYPNGQIASETEIVDGFESGSIREWYPSGNLKFEGYGKPGERFSWSKEWFENGNLKHEAISEYHVQVKEIVWDEQGKIISKYERASDNRKIIVRSGSSDYSIQPKMFGCLTQRVLMGV